MIMIEVDSVNNNFQRKVNLEPVFGKSEDFLDFTINCGIETKLLMLLALNTVYDNIVESTFDNLSSAQKNTVIDTLINSSCNIDVEEFANFRNSIYSQIKLNNEE